MGTTIAVIGGTVFVLAMFDKLPHNFGWAGFALIFLGNLLPG